MGHHYFLRVQALVGSSLIAGSSVIDMLDDLVLMPVQVDLFFFPGRSAANSAVLVGIVRQSGIVLAM